jgi:hypothetical protein
MGVTGSHLKGVFFSLWKNVTKKAGSKKAYFAVASFMDDPLCRSRITADGRKNFI